MKHISECMARDSEGGAKKKKNLLSSNDISIFFHKFAISLKGQCKLGLLTNELLGQDMKFQ